VVSPGGAGLGLLGRIERSPYRGIGARQDLIPLYVYEGGNAYLRSYRVGLKFDAQPWRLDFFLTRRFEGTPYELTPDELPGLTRREQGADVGVGFAWREPQRTLYFEAMRDAFLATSGKLDPALGGRPVNLTGSGRRTIYGFVDRLNLPNLYRIFDLTGADAHIAQRFTTTTPQQALFRITALVVGFYLARNLLLLFIVAPFFVTYLIRTLAWETILSDNGFVVNTLQTLHVLGPSGRLLATSTAVVTGITYNFLPFMALPLYVSLEQIDGRMIEAAEDLYASKLQAFLRVTFPLSLPGVVAGTLLTFIPAAGDFINAQLLGSPDNHMIGNVIQSKFLELTDYPAAAAMSFILMAGILIAVFLYARLVGTEQLTGTAG